MTADLLRRAGEALEQLPDCPPDAYEEDCRWINHGYCRLHPGLYVALTRELAAALATTGYQDALFSVSPESK